MALVLLLLAACGSNRPSDANADPDAGTPDSGEAPDRDAGVDDAGDPGPAAPRCPSIDPLERQEGGDPFFVGGQPMEGWDPFVLRDEEGTYRAWYTLYAAPTLGIAYAESPDGLSWTVHSPPHVLRPSEAGWDRNGMETVTVVEKDGTTYLWYLGYPCNIPETRRGRYKCIGLATSEDGLSWVKHPEPVLFPETTWEAPYVALIENGVRYWDGGVQEPSVVWDEDEQSFRMWYEGRSIAGSQIGTATSPDGITWTKDDANPVFRPLFEEGAGSEWEDRTFVGHTNVVGDPDLGLHLFYSTRWAIGHAFSLDGLSWERDAANPVVPAVFDPAKWDCTPPFAEFVAFGGPSARFEGNRLEIFLMRSPPDAVCWGKCEDRTGDGLPDGCSMTLGLAVGTCGAPPRHP